MNGAGPEGGLRVAYLVNQYPWVSQTFIRREILALERQGVAVQRIALRGWDYKVVDPEDQAEQQRTSYVLKGGVLALAGDVLRMLAASPARFFSALRLAQRMSRHADRGLAYHAAYFAEACRVRRWLAESGAQHVHAHFGTNSAEVAMLARELGAPQYSMTVHGPDEFDRPRSIGLGEKLRRAAFAVAISSYGRSQLYRWVESEHWPRIHIVHCGLEPAFHEGQAQVAADQRLVCIGRLCDQKGQMLLVEAAQRLASEGVPFELVLAGDGERRADLEALIAKYGLAERIRITGWITSAQVREELLAARGLVSASFSEGLPVVVMEAMALRRPVLATYVAGIPELVRPGVDGWLVPAGSIGELVGGIRRLLDCPRAELARMGDAARARVLERHSADTEAAKLGGLIREAIARERAQP